MIYNFSDKSAKLKKVEPYNVNDRWYLRLIYEYQSDNGEIFEMEIPMLELPFTQDTLPDIITYNNSGYSWDEDFYLIALFSNIQEASCILMHEGKSTISDNAEGCFIRKCICKRMTVEDIEKELGYKIEIVDKV